MKVLFFTRYDRLGASSRLRTLQFIPALEARGIRADIQPLFPNDYLRSLYSSGRRPLSSVTSAYLRRLMACARLRQYDLVWIEKELFPWLPAVFESIPRAVGARYVIDYDDAIHHSYDENKSAIVRGVLGGKLHSLLVGSAGVSVGNEYLAEWARRAGAPRVKILPTVVDIDRYRVARPTPSDTELRIGWIGSPATSQYLDVVREALKCVSSLVPVKLVVIGVDNFAWDACAVERHPWTEDSEADLLANVHIGIMPLYDSPWERGKCGYKLIQYMATGLPTIASPVGVNVGLVDHGVSGYLAKSTDEWVEAFLALRDEDLRQRMGKAGRQRVEKDFSLSVTVPKLEEFLRSAVGSH